MSLHLDNTQGPLFVRLYVENERDSATSGTPSFGYYFQRTRTVTENQPAEHYSQVPVIQMLCADRKFQCQPSTSRQLTVH